jgi:hypothetical protein
VAKQDRDKLLLGMSSAAFLAFLAMAIPTWIETVNHIAAVVLFVVAAICLSAAIWFGVRLFFRARTQGDMAGIIDTVGEEAMGTLYKMRSELLMGIPWLGLPSNTRPIVEKLCFRGLVEVKEERLPDEVPPAQTQPPPGSRILPLFHGARTIKKVVITDLGKKAVIYWESRPPTTPQSLP